MEPLIEIAGISIVLGAALIVYLWLGFKLLLLTFRLVWRFGCTLNGQIGQEF